MDKHMDVALKAIDKVLDNLASSDFVTQYGSKVLDGLREYRADMAADIAATFEENR